jgi:predicted lipid-binding transport protein (Tim44 family)
MRQTALNKCALLLVLAVLSVGLANFDAHAAKRHGSGNSLDKQHDSARRQASPITPPPVQTPAPLPAPAGSTWLFAGLAAGGLLAALFTGGAFNGIRFADIAMFALLFVAVFFTFRMMRKKPSNEMMQYAALGAETTPSLPARMFGGVARPAPYPIGFEIDPFLRNAKAGFIRLQAANDKKDLDVIRDYTTPETFDEFSKQIAKRGYDTQKTDIITLDAEVLEVAIEGNLASASVRFSGIIRKAVGAPARPFYEIWNVQKSLSKPDSVWLLAGIKQVR